MGLSGADFDYLRDLVLGECGVVVEEESKTLVEVRLDALCARVGIASGGALVARARAEPGWELRRRVVEALANAETLFFRDHTLFQSLRDEVLPSLLARRQDSRGLSIWSAACSTGQEPYSLAMLTDGMPELAGWTVSILATDLSLDNLERARAGRFSQFEVNRGLPAAMLVKHFTKQGDAWIIDPRLRERISFREINLTRPWPWIPLADLVLLRNVLIYFSIETRRAILARVREILRPDGVLVLGAAETTLHLDDAFERIPLDGACSYRLRAR